MIYRHDASAADAIVMKSPSKEHIKKFNKKSVCCVIKGFVQEF